MPVHRLAYSFGWEGDEEVPPGSSLIEIDLTEKDGGTLLRMTQTGLPERRTMRQPCARLGPLPRQAGGRRVRPRPGSGSGPHPSQGRMMAGFG